MGRWRGVARFSILTAAQQGVLAIAGIVTVRALPIEDYTHYSVIVGLVAAVALIAEGGVNATVMSEGGRRKDAPEAFVALLRASERFRAWWLLGAVIFAAPLAWYLLTGVGSAGAAIAPQAIAIVFGAFAMSGSTLYASALRLQTRFDLVAGVLFATAAAKLALVACLALFWRDAALLAIFVAITVVLFAVEAMLFRRKLGLRGFAHVPRDPALARQFRTNARRQSPNSIYYVLQGQLLPVLLVATGSIVAIGKVAALGRYGLLFIVLATIVAQQFMTRLARIDPGGEVARIWRQALVWYVAAGAVALVAVLAFRDLLLQLLGPDFADLGKALLIVSVGAWVDGAVAVLASLNHARAWLRYAWLQIPMSIAWLALLIYLVRPTDVESAAWFMLLATLPGVVSMTVSAIIGMRDERAVAASDMAQEF